MLFLKQIPHIPKRISDRFHQTRGQKRDYNHLSLVSIVLYFSLIPTALLYLAARLSPTFADFFNRHVSQPLRILYAKLTDFLPFSLAEGLLILSPVFLFLLIRHAIRYRTATRRKMLVYFAELISGALAFLIVFVWNFGIGYYTKPLDDASKLDLDRTNVSAQELYDTTLCLIEQINRESAEIHYCSDGFSLMPYAYREMNEKLLDAYRDFCAEYDFMSTFSSHLKPVMLSEAMSYTHITGVYSYFSGEANINVVFPDYTIPYTSAHELAHQRGIARENEANFIAFLVCIRSNDPYLRYSGYLNLYEYVSSALYRADPSLYFDAYTNLTADVRRELRAYSDFFDQYRDSTVGEISSAVNNTYLQIQGTEGTRSYGLVVDLAVAYYKKN